MMYAPKPAICGNGHAAMMRPVVVNKDLLVDQPSTKKVVSINTKKNQARQNNRKTGTHN